jgi:hypothetical protein
LACNWGRQIIGIEHYWRVSSQHENNRVSVFPGRGFGNVLRRWVGVRSNKVATSNVSAVRESFEFTSDEETSGRTLITPFDLKPCLIMSIPDFETCSSEESVQNFQTLREQIEVPKE